MQCLQTSKSSPISEVAEFPEVDRSQLVSEGPRARMDYGECCVLFPFNLQPLSDPPLLPAVRRRSSSAHVLQVPHQQRVPQVQGMNRLHCLLKEIFQYIGECEYSRKVKEFIASEPIRDGCTCSCLKFCKNCKQGFNNEIVQLCGDRMRASQLQLQAGSL